jgi:hypothetical protein
MTAFNTPFTKARSNQYPSCPDEEFLNRSFMMLGMHHSDIDLEMV